MAKNLLNSCHPTLIGHDRTITCYRETSGNATTLVQSLAFRVAVGQAYERSVHAGWQCHRFMFYLFSGRR